MSALLYVNPLLGLIDPRKVLNGRFVDEDFVVNPSRPVVNVKWKNFDPFPKNTNTHAAMLELDRLLHLYPGTPEDPTDIVCHSAGSEVADKWMREMGPFSDIPVNSIRWWLLGDPEAPFTGACYLYPTAMPPVYPGVTPHTASCPTPPEFHGGYGVGFGAPPVCPWTVNYVIHQYDGWAMAPLDPDNVELRRFTGLTFFGIPLSGSRVWDFSLGCVLKQASHKGTTYEGVNIDAGLPGGVVTYVDPLRPTIKMWYVRQYPVPSLSNVRVRFLARDLDIKRRPIMDLAYGPYNPGTRKGLPVTIPPPDYAAVPSWFALS